MRTGKRNYDAVLKAKVAMEAVKEEKTISQLSSEYGIHGNLIGKWKQHLLNELPILFSDRRKRTEKEGEELKDELYRQIGQLKVEVEWLKKKSMQLGLMKGGR